MSDQRPLSEMQEKIYSYIQSVIRLRGYPPTVREIGEAVGLKSPSTVHGHLTRLEKKGYLHRDAMKPRAMGICNESYQDEATVSEVSHVPVIGQVAAGIPILAQENTEAILPMPKEIVGDGDIFILRVKGESMINAGILPHDYIVVRKQEDAQNGEIVVAMIEDEATVKRIYKENGHVRLQPENDYMAPIITDHVTVIGKVVSLLRKI